MSENAGKTLENVTKQCDGEKWPFSDVFLGPWLTISCSKRKPCFDNFSNVSVFFCISQTLISTFPPLFVHPFCFVFLWYFLCKIIFSSPLLPCSALPDTHAHTHQTAHNKFNTRFSTVFQAWAPTHCLINLACG